MVKKRVGYFLFALLLVISGLVYWFYFRPAPFSGKIALVPLGKDVSETAFVKKEIEQFFSFKVQVLPGDKLPEAAYYKPRNRYRALVILDHLAERRPAGQDKIVALTHSDISVKTPEHADWGIMGLARLGGECCVISSFRLKRDKPSQKLFQERLAKVSLHEVGHTLGLPHCDAGTTFCLMNDAHGSVKTVDKEAKKLCSACRQKIAYTQTAAARN